MVSKCSRTPSMSHGLWRHCCNVTNVISHYLNIWNSSQESFSSQGYNYCYRSCTKFVSHSACKVDHESVIRWHEKMPMVASNACILLVKIRLFPGEQFYVEKCTYDTFNATCGHDSLIVVTSAVYGRLRAALCITKSYGYMGKNISVLPEVSRVSSQHDVTCRCHLRELHHSQHGLL